MNDDEPMDPVEAQDINPSTIDRLFRRRENTKALDEADIVLAHANKQKLRNDISAHLREFLDNGGEIILLDPEDRHGPVLHANGQVNFDMSSNKEKRAAMLRALNKSNPQ